MNYLFNVHQIFAVASIPLPKMCWFAAHYNHLVSHLIRVREGESLQVQVAMPEPSCLLTCPTMMKCVNTQIKVPLNVNSVAPRQTQIASPVVHKKEGAGASEERGF